MIRVHEDSLAAGAASRAAPSRDRRRSRLSRIERAIHWAIACAGDSDAERRADERVAQLQLIARRRRRPQGGTLPTGVVAEMTAPRRQRRFLPRSSTATDEDGDHA